MHFSAETYTLNLIGEERLLAPLEMRSIHATIHLDDPEQQFLL